MHKLAKLEPVLWGSLILVVSQVFTIYIAFREKDFVEANRITTPDISLQYTVIYFFIVVIIMGLILFLIPVYRLRFVFRIIFALMFSWGVFIVLGLTLPVLAAAIISAAAGLLWLFIPLVWLHNLLLIVTLVGVGSAFGFLMSPWTAMSFMLLISIYDVVAVRFGYTVWMAKELSESDTLPVFVLPRRISYWKLNLRKSGFRDLFHDKSAEREFSILGGGDIGFPLLLVVSVFFAYNFASSIIVAVFSLLGLISAFVIQMVFLKEKPMPALPPISFLSLIGLLIVYLL
ncbi:presenilin family intramembrane aspartyl protease [Chloroflexota bacterium]